MGPILTTWRTFSLFRMPSRRPRVIPATFNSLVPLIMWLSATSVSHPARSLHAGAVKPTFTSSDANSSSLNLETETPLILPERGGHTRLHSRWRLLTCGVEASILVLHGILSGHSTRQWQHVLWLGQLVRNGRRCWRRRQAIGVAVLAVRASIGVLRGLLLVVVHGGGGDSLRRRARHVLGVIDVGALIHGDVAGGAGKKRGATVVERYRTSGP